MRYTTPILAAVVGTAFLFSGAEPVQGQKKDDIVTLQRDIYEVRRLVEESNAGQTEKIAEMQKLLQQMNTAVAAELKKLSDRVAADTAEQRQSLSAPLGDVKRDVGDLSTVMLSMQTNVSEINRRQDKMGAKVDDFELLLRTALRQIEDLANKPALSVAPAPNPEQSAQMAFAAAYAQRAEGKLVEALAAFRTVWEGFPASPFAPLAMYEAGTMYVETQQYDQAVQAFDQVLEQFGENAMKARAQFAKADALEKLDRKDDAIREYENFAKQNPGDMMAQTAIDRASALKTPARNNSKAKGKGK